MTKCPITLYYHTSKEISLFKWRNVIYWIKFVEKPRRGVPPPPCSSKVNSTCNIYLFMIFFVFALAWHLMSLNFQMAVRSIIGFCYSYNEFLIRKILKILIMLRKCNLIYTAPVISYSNDKFDVLRQSILRIHCCTCQLVQPARRRYTRRTTGWTMWPATTARTPCPLRLMTTTIKTTEANVRDGSVYLPCRTVSVPSDCNTVTSIQTTPSHSWSTYAVTVRGSTISLYLLYHRHWNRASTLDSLPL